MVWILANGDIVQNDDPRVRVAQYRDSTPRQGIYNTAQNVGPPPQQPQEPGARPEGRSPFSEFNQQLVNMGFPRWNFGNQVVEPVVSIVLLLLIMMMGVRGLLLVGFVYVISHLSQR